MLHKLIAFYLALQKDRIVKLGVKQVSSRAISYLNETI